MVFNSLQFAVFFAAVYAAYRLLPHRAQNWWLLGASYWFYAAWDWRFLSLIIVQTAVNFVCGRAIADTARPAARRSLLLTALGVDLLMLGFFKYFNFFAENLHNLFGLFGWQVDTITLRVALPVGISFYTFMTMSYVIDVYRREVPPSGDWLEFAVFVAFFPHLVAGPILRASLLLPQIASPRTVTGRQVRDGVWLVAWGLFKKMVVADNLAVIAEEAFQAGGQAGGFEVLLGAYAFAFQIYGDFSGYTDIARGTSKLLGIELNPNFRFPYFVRTPQEFWAHWHISLSTWLRDYLFLPLSFAFSRRLDGVRWFGLRDDVWIYAAATMVTMLLGGLWHGAAWTFVLWGAYQGLLLVVFRIARPRRRRGRSRGGWLVPALGGLGMFHLTCFGWIIFRAKTLQDLAGHLWQLVFAFAPSRASLESLGAPTLFCVAALMIVHALEAWYDDDCVVFRLPVWARSFIFVALGYGILLFGRYEGAEFIYFQF